MLATARPQATAIARSVLFSIIRPAHVGRLPRQPRIRYRFPPIIPSFPRILRANATVSPGETVRARLRTVLRLIKFTTSTVLRSTANSNAPTHAHCPPCTATGDSPPDRVEVFQMKHVGPEA